MNIKFVLIGKTSFKFVQEGMDMYFRRLKRFVDFEISIIPDIKNQKKTTNQQIKEKEGKLILKQVKSNDFLILLDEKGKSLNSLKFADFIRNKQDTATKQIIFAVGGAYGFSNDVYKRADFLLSMSAMTFSHQIIRLFFMEQIYRAYSIINSLPYHNE
ncbi:MAG: 23S rRNA (pseudouridine(1915)-N(3))-methyltransferase RlmH [Bacteroidales bacterium]|nr:23S rRNA (pseudouridine(1915)-N(3))-methyltransferase RlmH [Bacteroidales bacterium]